MKKTIFTLMLVLFMVVAISCGNKTTCNTTDADTCVSDTIEVVDTVLTDTCVAIETDTVETDN
jgi:uncharacterized protein YcfL